MTANVHHPFQRERYLTYLSSTDIAALDKERSAVILPIGSVEQHGPHLPVITDALLGQMLLARALERVDPDTELWVLPPVAYGKSNEHQAFPGTMTLSQSTLTALVSDIGESVARAGFRRLIIYNSHGGNPPVLEFTARDVRQATGLITFPLYVFNMGIDYGHHNSQEELWGTHAGEWETSIMLALAGDLVHMDRTAHLGEYPAFTTPAEHITVIGPTHFAWLTEDLSEDGQLGDPRLAKLSRGEKIVELTVEKLARVLTKTCQS